MALFDKKIYKGHAKTRIQKSAMRSGICHHSKTKEQNEFLLNAQLLFFSKIKQKNYNSEMIYHLFYYPGYKRKR